MAGTSSSGGRSVTQKSRQQHELAGTYRKDRHAELKSPEPTPGQPDPPAELDSLAQGEWDRMMWAFEDMGMLHKVDLFAVYQHCKLYSETERVSDQQSEMEESLRILQENVPDLRKENPLKLVELFQEIVMLRKLVSKCTDQLRAGRMAIRQYLVEFGLTPASRGRIRLPSKREQVDEFSAYQRAKAG